MGMGIKRRQEHGAMIAAAQHGQWPTRWPMNGYPAAS